MAKNSVTQIAAILRAELMQISDSGLASGAQSHPNANSASRFQVWASPITIKQAMRRG
ncbi:hypothetical protein AAKU55_005415 [Oxalobacteraceae bacterium GrIS 1.11]